jgi:hypothetical protein
VPHVPSCTRVSGNGFMIRLPGFARVMPAAVTPAGARGSFRPGAGAGCWPGRPSDRGPGGILVHSSAMPASPASGSTLPAGANTGPVSAVVACLAMGPGPAGLIR